MVILTFTQLILLCIALFFFGFAAGYVVKCTVMKDNDTDKERN